MSLYDLLYSVFLIFTVLCSFISTLESKLQPCVAFPSKYKGGEWQIYCSGIYDRSIENPAKRVVRCASFPKEINYVAYLATLAYKKLVTYDKDKAYYFPI